MKKIGTKLMLSFMVVIALMIGFSSVLYFSMSKLANSIAKFNRYGEEQTVAGDLRLNLMWLTMPANDYIITADKEEYLKEFTAQLSVLENNFKNIEPFELSDKENAIVKELHESFDAIKKVGLSIFEIKNPVGNRKAAELMKEMDYKYAEPAGEKVNELFDSIKNKRVSASEAADEAVRTMKLTIVIGTLLAAGISVFIAVFIARSISTPLGRMSVAAQKISRGELEANIDVDSRDEVGVLANAFREMIVYLKDMAHKAERISEGDLTKDVTPRSEKDILGNAFKKMIKGLSDMVAQVRSGSEQIASASAEVGATSEQSSKNGEMAATAVEEITSTMHEMSTNIQNVAKSIQSQSAFVTETSASIEQLIASIERVAVNAKKLVEIANQSNDVVVAGKMAVDLSSGGVKNITNIMCDSAETIRLLGSRTEDIGKIIDVIDDIAEQTNLLALNAAIEAARAGEHGMGFAVVADEVRNLAERSAKSTAEISELIRGIQKDAASAVQKVEKNVEVVSGALKLSNEVVESLRRIELSVAEVARYSQEIGAATSEQAGGCGEISKAVVKLNDITQEISSSADEQASGTEQVVKGVEKLREMTAQNAASATQLASAAEQMRRQSESLNVTVARFSVAEEQNDRTTGRFDLSGNVKRLRLAAN